MIASAALSRARSASWPNGCASAESARAAPPLSGTATSAEAAAAIRKKARRSKGVDFIVRTSLCLPLVAGAGDQLGGIDEAQRHDQQDEHGAGVDDRHRVDGLRAADARGE